MSEPKWDEVIAVAHAISPALIDLDVVARKPIQGEAMHKVIGYRAFDALKFVGWQSPECYPDWFVTKHEPEQHECGAHGHPWKRVYVVEEP